MPDSPELIRALLAEQRETNRLLRALIEALAESEDGEVIPETPQYLNSRG